MTSEMEQAVIRYLEVDHKDNDNNNDILTFKV
jgi:hypothetical protein